MSFLNGGMIPKCVFLGACVFLASFVSANDEQQVINKVQNRKVNNKQKPICLEPRYRLGNVLSSYIKYRWLAYKTGSDFYYLYFKHSEKLRLSDFEKRLDSAPDPALYDCRCFHKHLSRSLVREIKNDPVFLQYLRMALSPRVPIVEVFPPHDVVSVALHLRKGGGYDPPLRSVQIFNLKYADDKKPKSGNKFVDDRFPLKFPPEQYYIDQIKNLNKMLGGVPLYVFIFTDDTNAEALASRIQSEVQCSNITIDYRHVETGHLANVIDDFCSMKNFDILIRPGTSTFTEIVDYFLGDFKIVIYPNKFHWDKDTKGRYYLIMDSITTDVRCDIDKIRFKKTESSQ